MDMRRILSLVLAIAMLVSLCPTQAFAAEVEGSAPVSGDTVTETPAESEDVLEEETHPALTMGTWSAVELSEGGTAYFTFTPEVTCTYKCWASADAGVSCSIYDTSMNLLGAGSNIENIHSYYSVEMTAGQTYVMGFRYADGNKAGSFEVSVIHTNASYNVTREPTCSVPGMAEYTCDTCAAAWTLEVPTAHNYTIVDSKSANCTEEGYTVYECVYCGDSYTETRPIWHDYANDICKVCGQGRTESGALNETTFWELNLGTDTLTISGTGATPDDLVWGLHPWNLYYYGIRHVVVEEGITRIGENLLTDLYVVETVSLPSTLTEIGRYALGGNSLLREIILPQGLTTIGNSAFSGCRSLEEIVIPDSVTEMGTYVFNYCENLRRAVIGEGITELPQATFEHCTALEEVVLPATLKNIDVQAFSGCASLRTIELPEGLERLTNWAFYNSGLEYITLPASLNDFNGNPFDYCDNLQYIDVVAGSESFIGVNGVLYSADGTTLLAIPTGWETFQVPEHVTWLNIYAFGGCRKLQSLVFTGDAPHAECGFDGIVTIYYPADNETWTAEVRNLYSGAIDWYPLSALMILVNPVPTETEGGATFTMSVLVQGTDVSYQWQVSSDNCGTWSDIPGANGSVLEQAVENGDDGTYYRCIVTDAAGNEQISGMALLEVVPTFYISGLYTTHYVTTTHGFDSYVYFTPDAAGSYYFLINDGNVTFDFVSMDGLVCQYDGLYECYEGMEAGVSYKFRIKAWDTEIEHHEFSIYIQDRPALSMGSTYVDMNEGEAKEFVFTPDEDGAYVIYNDYWEPIEVSAAVLNGDGIDVGTYCYSSDRTGYVMDLEAGKTYIITVYRRGTEYGHMIVAAQPTPAEDLYTNRYEDVFGMAGTATNLTVFTNTRTAARPNLVWTTDNPDVATAEAVEGLQGRVNFIGAGSCTITVTDADSGASTSFGIQVAQPAVLSMGDNTVRIDSNSTGYFSFTAEEAGTYVFHLPWEDERYEFYRLDAAGNQYYLRVEDANQRYGFCIEAQAGETFHFAFRNNNWNGENADKTLTVDKGIPAEQIGLNVDCIAGTLGSGMTRFIFEENILQIGAKYTAVSDDPGTVVAGIDEFGDLTLEFKTLGSCHVTISTVNAAGETVSKTITVKVKLDQILDYGEYTLELMYGETEYFLFTPEESGYYVIYFPDLTDESWEVSIGQYDSWVSNRYSAAGSRGFMAWLDADVQAMIHVDNNVGDTDTQRFVFAQATDATGIQVSRTEVTGNAEEIVRLTATVLPATFVNGGWLSWESSDGNVVCINSSWDEGRVAELRLCGPGTATVRVFNDDLGIEAFVTVTVNPENPLTLGENTRFIPSYAGETFFYFRPEVSGDYVLTYPHGLAHIQHVQTLDGTYPTQQHDVVDDIYVRTATLEAGVWYRYSAFAYSDGDLTFSLNLAEETTGITLEKDALELMLGVEDVVYAHLQPMASQVNDLTWESSNEEIFTVEETGSFSIYATVTPVGVGEATLTVRTEEGHEVSIPVVVTMPPALELGENTVTAAGWRTENYSFTAPADGTYVLSWPIEQGRPNVWTADEEAVQWKNLGAYSYAAYSMTMTAGQTCILYVNGNSSGENSWTMTVAPAQNAEAVTILAPKGDTGYVGTALTLFADVQPGAAATDGLTWSISDERVGMIIPVGEYEASVYFAAGGFADITVTTNSGLSTTYRIYSEVPENLFEGDSKEVTLEPGNQIVYTFTPDKDGWYVLYYGEEENIFDLVVTDGNGAQPSYSFHSSGSRMAHRMQLTGGKTYYLSLFHDSANAETATRSITLAKATDVESVTLTPNQRVYTVGGYGHVSVELNPITAVESLVGWGSSDPNVVRILGMYSDGFDFECPNAGTATVTLEYASGYTASIDITVSDYETLEEGDNSLFINVGEEKTYLFTPSQTGLYGLTTWFNPWQTTVTTADGEAVACTDYVRYYQYETRRGYLFELEEGVTYKFTVYNGYYGDTESDWQWFALLPDAPAESIELNTYDIDMEQGGSSYLAAYINPANAYTAEVTWVVGDESIVSIDEYGDVRAVGVGTTTITAVSGEVSAVCNVTVNEPETVTEGTYDVWMDSWGGSKSYRFVPEEDGTYVFALDGDNWGMMMLHVYENGVDVTGDLDYYRTSQNVGRSLTLTAGAEYILNFNNMNEWPYGGCVYIYRSEGISQVRFEQDTVSGYVGKSSEILPWIDPQFAAGEMLTVESSDPNVVSVEAMYKHGISLQYLSVGTATVTVTAASGATDTLTVHVTEIPTLTMGELIDIHMDQLDTAYYRFTVETEGVYVLVRPNEENYAELRNVDTYDYPYYSENWGGDYYFNIYVLEPGTYELYLEAHNELDGQLGIGPRVASQTLDISETEVTLRKDGQWKSLFAILDSPFAIGQAVEWTCADENIVRVTSQDVGGVRATLEAVNVGQTTVTATLGDISVTCTVTVEAIPELTEGQEVTVTSDEVDQLHYFTFTPETTGVYTFMASRSDVLVDQIETYTCSTSGRLLMYLERNQTYTVSYRIMNQGTGTFDVAVKAGNYCGMNATWTLEDGVLTITGTGDLFDYEDVDLASASPWINYQGEITEVVISDGITSIGDLSFMDLSLVKTLTVPASVTRIGAAAFRGCYALETIVFEGDAPIFAENALEESYYTNIVYPAGNATWTEDVKQNYCGNDIKWSDGAYLSYRYLQNEGFGYFNMEYRMFVFTAMDTTPGDNNAVIFYTNIWDGQTWTVTPVDVQGNEFVILEKIMDVAPDAIESGASKAEYFYFLNVTDDSWNQPAAVSFTLDNGRVLSVPISVGLPEHGFYSAPEITPENYITSYTWNPDSTEERVFYYGYNQEDDRELVELRDYDEEYGEPTYGAEYITLEALENGMYKITVNRDAPDEFGINLIAVLRDRVGQEAFVWMSFDCHAGQSTRPYLEMYDLEWSEEGWYLVGDSSRTDFTELVPNAHLMVVFAVSYVNENGQRVVEPVEIQWTDGLTVTKIQDLEGETVHPDAKFGEYYYQVSVDDWFLTETISFEWNGEILSFVINSDLPELAYYSAPEVSPDNYIDIYEWDPDSDASRDFYFGAYGDNVTEITLSAVDPDGNTLPGTEYVTLTKLDNGMYKITVSSDVETEFLLDLWLTVVYADGSVGDGTASMYCYPGPSYKCGDDATWAFDEATGTLTISGTGALYDSHFAGETAIKHLIIEEGITSTGSGTFDGCTALVSVELPTTLTEIGVGAFYNTGLTELTVPEGVTVIGMSAFGDCADLTVLTLPGTLTEIGTGAFQNCTGLTVLSLPEGLLTLGTGAFRGCTGLADVTLPESLGVIWGDAFNGCTALKEITIPSGVEAMYWSVFKGCTALRKITFLGIAPCNILDDVTYPVLDGVAATAYYPGDNDTWTGEVMASYGGNITWVPVYPTSGKCGENVYWSFDATTGLLLISGQGAMDEHVGDPSAYPWYPFKYDIVEVSVEEGVTNVGAFAFSNYTQLGLVWLNDVETVGDCAFSDCVSLRDVMFTDNLISIGAGAFANTDIFDFYLNNGVTSIGDEAFMGSSLTTITIPGTVTEWGNGVFQECLDLKDATFNEGITAVPSYIFVGCTALETVVFSDTVTSIGECAFKGCSNLKYMVLREGMTALYTEAFGDCVSLTSIKIPASVERMLKPFKGCTGLTEITFLGDAPEIYDDEAFAGVTATVYYPGGNATWTEEVLQQYGGNLTWVPVNATSGQCGENAYWSFDETTGTLTISGEGAIDSYPVHMGKYAPWYDLRDEVISVVVEEGITDVGTYDFFKMSNLKTVSYSSTVRSISPNINCNAIEEYTVAENNPYLYAHDGAVISKISNAVVAVPAAKAGTFTVPEGIRTIDFQAFLQCANLTGVILPNSLERIEYHGFYGCKGLKSIEIPKEVTYIGQEAFAFCDSLAEITFLGDAPSLDAELFYGVTLTAYYPGDNATWTEEVLQQYGGTITWVPVYDVPVLELGVVQDVTYSETFDYYTYHFTPAEDGYFAIHLTADVDAYLEVYTVDSGFGQQWVANGMITAGSGKIMMVPLRGGVTYVLSTYIMEGAPAEGSIWVGTTNYYVTGLEITNLPDRLTYVEGFVMDVLDLDGLEMTVTWADGTTTSYAYETDYYKIGDYKLAVAMDEETGEIVLTCCEGAARFAVEQTENTVAGLEIANADEIPGLLEGAYYTTYGGYSPHVITRKVQFRVTYTDGTSEIINMLSEVNGYSVGVSRKVEGPDGTNRFTFSLLGAEAVYEASFAENPVASIEVVSDPDPLVYGVDDHVMKDAEGVFRYRLDGGFRFPGLAFRINYTDGTSRVVSFADLTWPANDVNFYNFPEYQNYPVEAQPYLPEYGEGWTYWSGDFAADENGEVAMRLHYMGSIAEFTLTLTNATPLEIIKQPESVTVAEGETATVTVEAQGDGLTYKWYYKNPKGDVFFLTNSFTGDTYSVVMNTSRSGRQIYCVIKDKYGNTVTTNTVTLKMK